jgi:hypothetical protein
MVALLAVGRQLQHRPDLFLIVERNGDLGEGQPSVKVSRRA